MSTIAAAVAARKAAHVRERAIAINRRNVEIIKKQQEDSSAYAAALRRQAFEEEQELKRRARAWLEKYDSDASGLLEVAELKAMLQDSASSGLDPVPCSLISILVRALRPSFMCSSRARIHGSNVASAVYPNAPAPTDELCSALIATCVAAAGHKKRRGIRADEVLATTARFTDYCTRKADFARYFARFDVDGSGLLEEPELRTIMTELLPRDHGRALCDADVAFVYDSCGVAHGKAFSVDALPALMPALAEWTRLAQQAHAAAAATTIVATTTTEPPRSDPHTATRFQSTEVVDGHRLPSQKPKATKPAPRPRVTSFACAVM